MSGAASRRLAPLLMTNAAINRIREICKTRPDVIGLRIGVKQRGCSGLTYTLDYATQRDKHDVEVIEEDVRVFMDRKAQLTLIGSTMDYKSDNLSSEFVFNNPNVTGMCGCGESFTVKKSSTNTSS